MDRPEATCPPSSPSARGAHVAHESDPLTPEDMADGLAAIEATYRRPDGGGVCVVDGFGCRVVVERGALEVHDGIGPHRRTRRYDRATHGLRRLVIVNAAGIVSLDALRWCQRLGIGVLVLGADGTAQLASTPRMTDDARLRRTQALALSELYGLDAARWLIARKLAGQGSVVLRRFGDDETSEAIGELVFAAEAAESLDELRGIEAAGAALYFGSWSGRPECVPRFAAKDRRRVPAHWMRFEGRRSVLASSNSNRKAERPVNALLNYCYSLAEAEAILACQAVGLDPGLGLVHSDAKARQSMALDVMEPVRPEVDDFVLGLLETRTFRKVEFVETPDGHVRLRAPLTHELAETMARWAQALAPVAEHVAHDVGAAMVWKYAPATPLTRRRTRDAQAAVRLRKLRSKGAASRGVAWQGAAGQGEAGHGAGASERSGVLPISPADVRSELARRRATARRAPRQRVSGAAVLPRWTCPTCGGEVTNPRHVRCECCIAADPRQGPEVRGRRGAAIAARKRALAEWDEANPGAAYDPELFRREILPRLQNVKLSAIMDAASCSKSFASTIRSGRWTPHVATWSRLAALAVPPGSGRPEADGR